MFWVLELGNSESVRRSQSGILMRLEFAAWMVQCYSGTACSPDAASLWPALETAVCSHHLVASFRRGLTLLANFFSSARACCVELVARDASGGEIRVVSSANGPVEACAGSLVQRDAAFVAVSHLRHCSLFSQGCFSKGLWRKGRSMKRHCSTLVVTQCSGVVSSLPSGLGDVTGLAADAVKAGLELQSAGGESALALPEDLQQRTEHWHSLRKGRITASAFGNALGFWKTGRAELWEEKLGLRTPFAGNQATVWGTNQEAGAIERYKQLTGNLVDHMAFKIYKEGDDLHGWLGASPDGLIDANLSRAYIQGGILEVKCPHNKGRPETGAPWTSVPHYYMPQAQGLLEIFDREWMDFYVWCVNGSSIYRIYRDERYWGLIFRVMSEYWWGNVVPAKHYLMKGNELDRVQVYRPQAKHPLTEEIVSMSRLLAARAPLIWKDLKSPHLGSDKHLQEKLELFYSL